MTDQRAGDRPNQPPPKPAENHFSSPKAFRHAVGAIGKAQLRRASGLVGAFLRNMGMNLVRRDPLHHVERRRVIDSLFHEGPRTRAFIARFASLMSLSVAIATLAIIADSTAVVIGAMLIAPLMGPVLGVAAGIVMGWPIRIARQSALVIIGSLVAVGLAAAISFVVPGATRPLPAEFLARTSPNLLDLGIALAAGAAGAYGQVRRQASDALPGVAVAVALVPPLAVIGVALQLTEWQMALGATLLFLINVVGIVASAAITFIASGFVPGRRLLSGNTSIASGLRWASVAVIIVVLPMQFGRGSVLPPMDQTAEAVEAVVDFVEDRNAETEVVNVTVDVGEGVTDIDVVLASSVSTPPVTILARHLAKELNTSVELSLYVVETETEQAIVTPP